MNDDNFFKLWLFCVIGGGLFMALVARARLRSAIGFGVLGATLGAIPFLGWFLYPITIAGIKKGDNGSEASTAAKAFGNGAQYAYVGDDTGIAIDTTQRVLRLKQGSTTREYPFEHVREWRTHLSTGGEVFAAGNIGFTGISSVAGQNARVARDNRQASGLFFSVRDIDRPEWRIDMPSEKNQKRWMEILRQTINND